MSKITIELDSHQLSSFELCPRLYYWSYLRHKEAPIEKPALSKGTAYHSLMQHFYTLKIARAKFEDCIMQSLELAKDELNGLPAMDQLLIKRKFIEYAGYYRNEAIVPVQA